MATPTTTTTPSPTTPAAPSAPAPAQAHDDGTPASSGRKSRAGRRPSAVWDYFSAIRTEHNTVHAQCRFCDRRCAGVAARMVQHVVSKCPKAPAAAVDALGGEAAVLAAAAMKRRKTGEHPSSSGGNGAKTKSAPAPPPAVAAEGRAPPQSDVAAVSIPAPPPAPVVSTVVSGELVEQQVAVAHQKLVLACVLNDIPLAFVEDETLMDAFAALHHDFPRLTAQVAQTAVLEDLYGAVAHRMSESLRQCEHFGILHRHSPQSGGESQAARPDLWLGLDGKNEPLLLAATSGGERVDLSETARSATSTTARLAEAEGVLTAQRARLPATATLGFCTNEPQLFSHLRSRQHVPQGDEDGDEGMEEANANAQRLKTLLLGTCLLQQTVALQKQLLQLAPSVVSLLQEATVLVYSLSSHPHLSQSLRAALLDLAHSCSAATSDSAVPAADQPRWDLPARVVKCLLSQESELRAFWKREEAPAASAASGAASRSDLPPHRDAFWDELRQVDALLAPFSWAFALSESDAVLSSGGGVTSAQFVLLWIWLLSIVHACASISADQRAALTSHTMALVRKHVDDHQLACMLLDPRVHGAGLSATGKRKVKTLVVQVAARVFPDDAFHVSGSSARTKLLAHLGHYTEKSSQFADEIAWEMSAGKPAELFWKDYVEDARELAKVARVVVKFAPHTQSVAATVVNSGSRAQGGAPQGEEKVAFQIRQIKQLYATPKRAEGGGNHASSDTVMAQYASILFPIGSGKSAAAAPATVSAAKDAASVGSLAAAGEDAAASRLLLAMAQQLQALVSSRGGSGSSSSQAAQLDDEARIPGSESLAASRGASKSPTKRQRNAAEVEAAAAEATAWELPVEDSWFAFRGDAERKEIEAAIKRFVLPSAAVVIV